MDSGKKVPTVREGLKRVSPVVVVDAQSPATGAEYLEGRIASARKFRGQIPEWIKQPETPRREAYVFLDRLIFPNGDINKKVLTHHVSPVTTYFTTGFMTIHTSVGTWYNRTTALLLSWTGKALRTKGMP